MVILDNNISKIAEYAFFYLNQLRELDISNNAIVHLPVHVFQGMICLKGGELETAMYMSFKNKLQDDAESSYIFINKAVLTFASYTRTIYYKYNRIPIFYHLASQKQIQKWVYFNILFVYLPLIVFFIYMFIYFWRFV